MDSLPTVLDASMPSPEKVRELESLLVQLPQVDLQTTHVIHGGLYARTILIPAGTMLTGAQTARDNVCIVCGDIEVTTDEGVQRLTGFHVLPAKAGAKRAGVTHADTWWTTVFRTDGQTVTECEDDVAAETDGLQTRNPRLASGRHQLLGAEQ